jgi:hypothetical protein
MSFKQEEELPCSQQEHQQHEAATAVEAAEGSSKQETQLLVRCSCQAEENAFVDSTDSMAVESAQLQQGYGSHQCSSSGGDEVEALK